MNREEALQEVCQHKNWPNNTDTPPEGWSWFIGGAGWTLVHTIHDPIKFNDWRHARSPANPAPFVEAAPAMNREEALAYTMNYVRWPKNGTVVSALPNVPIGWRWMNHGDFQQLIHPTHDPITYSDWAQAVDLGQTSTPAAESSRLTAPDFLERGAQHMRDRAAQRDKPDGERSMARAVAAFNAQEGASLTEEQGWRFMVQLKYSRACAGVFVADDYEDMAAYAGLAGESAARG